MLNKFGSHFFFFFFWVRELSANSSRKEWCVVSPRLRHRFTVWLYLLPSAFLFRLLKSVFQRSALAKCCIVLFSDGSGIACWLERRTRDRKVASSNPGRVKFVCWLFIRCPFRPRVTAVARERPRSFCEKCRWQVTLKHAYSLDPTKSEWADYAAIQA